MEKLPKQVYTRSGYHAWATRHASQRTTAKARLKLAALAAHHRTRTTYVAVRYRKELASDGFSASLGTVKRIRRELGLSCVQQKRRFRVMTTDSQHTLPVAPNLLEQRFTALRPDEVWTTDITSCRLKKAGYTSRRSKICLPEKSSDVLSASG
jgi:transposase InsO family protein